MRVLRVCVHRRIDWAFNAPIEKPKRKQPNLHNHYKSLTGVLINWALYTHTGLLFTPEPILKQTWVTRSVLSEAAHSKVLQMGQGTPA